MKLFTGVRYVLNLKRNLISLGELHKKGYVYKGEQGVLKVVKGSEEVMRGIKRNELYSPKVETITGSDVTISTNYLSKTDIWHARLGHASKKKLIELGKQNLLCGEKFKNIYFSKPCVFGKACKVKINKVQ